MTVIKPTITVSPWENNIHTVLSHAVTALKAGGLKEQATSLKEAVLNSKSHDEAVAHILNVVDLGFTVQKYGGDLPAGQYIVSDPCYVLSEQSYNALLDIDDGRWNGTYEINGIKIAVHGTEHGDGRYEGNRAFYSVDSGHIAIVPLSSAILKEFTVTDDHVEIDGQTHRIFDVNHRFGSEYIEEGGIIEFGSFERIVTGTEPCDECGGKDPDNCECDVCGGCYNYCDCGEDEDEDED